MAEPTTRDLETGHGDSQVGSEYRTINTVHPDARGQSSCRRRPHGKRVTRSRSLRSAFREALHCTQMHPDTHSSESSTHGTATRVALCLGTTTVPSKRHTAHTRHDEADDDLLPQNRPSSGPHTAALPRYKSANGGPPLLTDHRSQVHDQVRQGAATPTKPRTLTVSLTARGPRGVGAMLQVFKTFKYEFARVV